MAKKGKNNTKKNKKESYNLDKNIDMGLSNTTKGIIGTIVGVLLVFGLFYLLAIYATSKGEKKEVAPASIGYEKILAGSVFDMKEKEYLVVMYNREDESDITASLSSYNTKHDVDAYYVDLADGLNQGVISDRVNTNVSDASDLEVKNPTLVKVKDKKIVESVDGKDDIINYLEKN